MKILSVTVPCYNSEAYMENCIHSLLPQILSLLAKRPKIVYIAATDGRYGGRRWNRRGRGQPDLSGYQNTAGRMNTTDQGVQA